MRAVDVPEGDNIFRAARTLHRAMSGHTVTRFESAFPALTRVHQDRPLTGRRIERVESAGKHILMYFSEGDVLRTHMRMNGSWHIYRAGERWQRPHRDVRILVATASFVAVGFSIPVAEFVRADRLTRHRELAALGPDLLSDSFDAAEAIRRLRDRRHAAIADALLDQRALAGVGNVYKSEVLFLCGIHPFATVDQVTDAELARLVETARTLLRANVSPRLAAMTTYSGLRRTTGRDNPGARLWVYGRGGRPCRRCGTPIEMDKRGLAARVTYWCPDCQAARSDAPGIEL